MIYEVYVKRDAGGYICAYDVYGYDKQSGDIVVSKRVGTFDMAVLFMRQQNYIYKRRNCNGHVD